MTTLKWNRSEDGIVTSKNGKWRIEEVQPFTSHRRSGWMLYYVYNDGRERKIGFEMYLRHAKNRAQETVNRWRERAAAMAACHNGHDSLSDARETPTLGYPGTMPVNSATWTSPNGAWTITILETYPITYVDGTAAIEVRGSAWGPWQGQHTRKGGHFTMDTGPRGWFSDRFGGTAPQYVRRKAEEMAREALATAR